ncbi:FAD/NAD-binding domain-containing protein [Fomitiporia mediterranea MF3/22]|uniref:FAD/NAD-binding domain-containing protein n=1 Tax=Fomitiporia mediterranea (strain MF3/22) TaxID=694068 RepID=UPI0004407431|nr:FAD/NAD-binding domain-containing protein [Fomitiporia mediterranea MF3/22]EJC99000.1 FAD/NAD-binding domain-containing protein [Fomitiporia mediterranea MF3/22]
MDGTTLDARQVALDWFALFSDHLTAKRADSVAPLFLQNGWLKDSLVFGWDTRALEGPEKIAHYLHEVLPGTRIDGLALYEQSGIPPSTFGVPESTEPGVEFAFIFKTLLIKGRGIARLVRHRETWKAFSVYLEADEIIGHEELGHELGLYGGHTIAWEEVIGERRAAIEKDPQVLIVGAGQSGLQTAARFQQMNIRTLVIDKTARVGDSWRMRYPTLTLHTPRTHHHLLYAPFPKNWPIFAPREKVAAWLEQYAESLDLVVWTSSSLLPGPIYDAVTGRWTVPIDKNGQKVVIHPNHVVLAAGLLGEPIMPRIPSSDLFKGAIIHASAFQGGHPFTGKRVLVVGAGNTSADICQDLVVRGAKEVTMLQRSETVVISSALKQKEWDAVFPEGVPTDVIDFKIAAMPMGQLRRILVATNRKSAEFDREMHEGLKEKGLNVSDGPDGAGNKILVFERSGGIDVGAADMIINCKIKIKSGVEIDRFKENGVVFTDGSDLEADSVIFATGYQNIRTTMRKIFGDAVIDKTCNVWGLDEEGEIRGCFRRSGYPRLWYAVGDFYCGRYMSKQLGILIKSEELGLTGLKSLASVPAGEANQVGRVGESEYRSHL